jgi:hypothetical protein
MKLTSNPQLFFLEDRTALSTYYVTDNRWDATITGTLPWAIVQSNTFKNEDYDLINIAIPVN